MLYKRTNKAGNLMELLSIEDVSFLRAKLEDRLHKTLLILKSGEIVHVNLTQAELDELVEKVTYSMTHRDFSNVSIKVDKSEVRGLGVPYAADGCGIPSGGSGLKPTPSPETIDEMLDDLTPKIESEIE